MTVVLQRSFLAGRDMGEAVIQERCETVMMLKGRGLRKAAAATVTSASFQEFFTMRDRMLSGGFHRVRLSGGRGIDR